MDANEKIAELESRINQLEEFISRNADLWDDTPLMIANSSLTETVLDTIERRVYVQQTASLSIDKDF